MPFVKLGENIEISKIENIDSCIPAVNAEVLENFKKIAQNLKKVAPRAEDFLYFSAIMMHAAEASALNDDGTPKLNLKGEPVKVSWDKSGGTWRWVTNDPSVKPYKNCFVPGTQIMMADGSFKNIEDIQVGDEVITHEGRAKKVLRKFITPHEGKVLRLKVKNNIDLVCTDNHPIYVLENNSFKFVKAGNLNNKSILLSINLNSDFKFNKHVLNLINEESYSGNVFNFEVEDDHSYVANGLVVSNCNGDIFPEEELVKAYKKWVHKPLCIDHKSSSVDHVRGFIVDTYYDRNLKRVVALCALDKHNYPDLARKVATGYSHCVSMGTAVGRAICSDCATIARTEHDFCEHMRNKSCYGEINVDLNPIELSIVVNGADPKANIKHIIAAANTMKTYLDNKSAELDKIASNYSAVLTVNSVPGETNNAAQFTVNTTSLETFKDEINAAFEQLENFKSVDFSKKDTNELAFNQSSGSIASDDLTLSNTDSGLAPPHNRFASADVNLVEEFRKITSALETQLSQMKQSLDKLLNTSKTIQEENNMSGNDLNKKAYFQGTEEPTPGQAKYPKDPMNEKLRESGDKQMVGQMDTGPVDGLHPGTDSSGVSEIERKKMLARAEAEERALKRAAVVDAVKKGKGLDVKAYFQGTEEPTPGKAQYPKDKLNEELRNKGDKHMVGQKPFPDVGAVDGLHPSPDSADVADEKKRKEMLSRANLIARFVTASNNDGSTNLAKSAWVVSLNEKPVLTASVDDLSGGNAEILFESIATREFGAKLIERVKTQGAEKVKSLFKRAQEAAPAPAPEAVPAPEAASPAPAADVEDTGASGDPKENIVELAEKARDLTSDVAEAVKALTGEQAEMGDIATASAAVKELNNMRKELNSELTDSMKNVIAKLESNIEELDMISGMYEKGAMASANQELVGSIVEDAVNDTKTAMAEGWRLITAFSQYARGTKSIVKRAELEAELNALAEGDSMSSDEDTCSSDDDLLSLINENNALLADDDLNLDLEELDADAPMSKEDEDLMKQLDKVEQDAKGNIEKAKEKDVHNLMAKPEELKDLQVKPGTHVEVTASLNTKEGRAALRAKLAADSVKFSPILQDAHPKGSLTVDFDDKPEGDLGVVETLEDQHSAILDIATAPVKVRKEAEAIHQMISQGKLDVADLDALVSEGLDKDAVTYYRKYYAQTEGGSEFANELVKEHNKAKVDEDKETYRVKLARAYELAYDMVDRGLCHHDRESVTNQVNEIMQCNDESFNYLKRVVASNPIVRGLNKQASKLPNVGVIGSGEMESSEGSLYDQLSQALNQGSKRSF